VRGRSKRRQTEVDILSIRFLEQLATILLPNSVAQSRMRRDEVIPLRRIVPIIQYFLIQAGTGQYGGKRIMIRCSNQLSYSAIVNYQVLIPSHPIVWHRFGTQSRVFRPIGRRPETGASKWLDIAHLTSRASVPHRLAIWLGRHCSAIRNSWPFVPELTHPLRG
jgi:hypothetical protein